MQYINQLNNKYCDLLEILEQLSLFLVQWSNSSTDNKIKYSHFLLKQRKQLNPHHIRLLQDFYQELSIIVYQENHGHFILNNAQLNYLLNILTDFVYDFYVLPSDKQALIDQQYENNLIQLKKMTCIHIFWQCLIRSSFWNSLDEHIFLNIDKNQINSIQKSLQKELDALPNNPPIIGRYTSILGDLSLENKHAQTKKIDHNINLQPTTYTYSPHKPVQNQNIERPITTKKRAEPKTENTIKSNKKGILDSFLEFFG